MSDLGLYLARATEYCAETRNLIEDVINSVHQFTWMHFYSKKAMLEEALKGMGFSDEQLTAFAKGEIPTEYQLVPCDVMVSRAYRIWVRVPVKSGKEEVKNAATKQILENGLDEKDLDPDLDIEEDDIGGIEIDWCGAQQE